MKQAKHSQNVPQIYFYVKDVNSTSRRKNSKQIKNTFVSGFK